MAEKKRKKSKTSDTLGINMCHSHSRRANLFVSKELPLINKGEKRQA